MLYPKQEWARVYLGNLPYTLGPRELIEFVGKMGYPCERPEIVKNRETGQSMGFAFVDLPKDKAEEAITVLNGQDLGGRAIRAAKAKERGRNAAGAI